MARDLIEQNREACMELPEMQALPSERWREFVMNLFDRGFHNSSAAAAAAGVPSESRNALRVTAHRMLHDGRTQLAIDAVSKVYLNALKPLALRALREALDKNMTPQATVGERLKGAEMVMSRTGLNQVQEHKHTVEAKMDDPGQLARIKTFADAMGLGNEIEKLIGARLAKVVKPEPVKVVDVEYEDEPDLEDLV